MNFIILIFGLIVLSMATTFGEERMISKVLVYTSNPVIRNAIDDYSLESITKQLRVEVDVTTRFLYLLDTILVIDKALDNCKGSHFLNVGITGRNGDVYSAGIPPQEIEDEVDRDNYIRAISVNTANYGILNLLKENRIKISDLLNTAVNQMPDAQRPIAERIIHRLRR